MHGPTGSPSLFSESVPLIWSINLKGHLPSSICGAVVPACCAGGATHFPDCRMKELEKKKKYTVEHTKENQPGNLRIDNTHTVIPIGA